MRGSLAALLLLLSGCATMLNGTHDELNIRSEPTDATYALRDSGGKVVATGRTPGVTNLPRSSGPYRAARYELWVSKEGYLPKRGWIDSRIDGWYWIDWILVVPGLLVDPFTGAMWNLIDPPLQILTSDIPLAPTNRQPSPHPR